MNNLQWVFFIIDVVIGVKTFHFLLIRLYNTLDRVFLSFSISAQELIVEGELKADSIDANAGIIENVKTPINPMDDAISTAINSATAAVETFAMMYIDQKGIEGLIGDDYNITELMNLGLDKVGLINAGLIDSLKAGGAILNDFLAEGASIQSLQ